MMTSFTYADYNSSQNIAVENPYINYLVYADNDPASEGNEAQVFFGENAAEIFQQRWSQFYAESGAENP